MNTDSEEEEVTSGSEYSPDNASSQSSEESFESLTMTRPAKRKGHPPVCNYGENCYRKNPDHFKEFGHPHLEKILAEHKGGDFQIPQNLHFQKQIVEQQLSMLKSLSIYPISTNVKKVSKNPDSNSNNKLNSTVLPSSQASTSTATVVNDPPKPNPPQNTASSAGSSGSVKEGPKKKIEDFFNVVIPKGKMEDKHKKAAPFYIFFTTITSAPVTHNQPLSITFQEILDPSFGILESSLQINFMVDIGWLLAQYYFAGYNNKPLTILYGDDNPDIKNITQKKPNVKAHLVPMQNVFGKHHTKMSILCYEDGSLRVVISTANLYIDDWENRTQGLWISPKCPALEDPIDIISGESPTGFKRSLINYLNSYSMSCLSTYLEKVKHTDFSAINVFFVASVPGSHFDSQWGMTRVGNLLSKHCVIPESESDKWEFIAQASSIGSYGNDPKLWLCGDFQSNFCNSIKKFPAMSKMPQLKLIYPSLSNVKNSHDNLLGGGCLPYSKTVHDKQTWLNKFLYEWSAIHSGRNKAMPHIKSYLRISPDYTKAAYFLLTSANVSKAAWGTINKGNKALKINSYEVGVLFIPQFVISKDAFSLEIADKERIPVPYDVPPIPYESSDVPWVMDYLS